MIETKVVTRLLPITVLLAFAGIVHLKAAPAEGGRIARSADLVAVVNKNPADPSAGEVWLMDLKGRVVRRITNNSFHEEHPRVSPDGGRIVFVRNVGKALPGGKFDPKRNELFVYSLITGKERRLTRNGVDDSHPEWSYDSRTILFSSARGESGGASSLWLMAADGSSATQLIRHRSGDLAHTHPVWAPDGWWVAFVNHYEKNRSRFARIEKIRRDGSQWTMVSSGGRSLGSTGTEGPARGDISPRFSTDGSMIWSMRRLQKGRAHLFAYGSNGYYGGKAEINMNPDLQPGTVEESPCFSSDGRRLIFSRSTLVERRRIRQIVLADPELSFRRHILSRLAWDVWDPSWFPSTDSGAERDDASRIVSHLATKPMLLEKPRMKKNIDNGVKSNHFPSNGAHVVVKKVRVPEHEAHRTLTAELEWKIEKPVEGVISLALSLEGRVDTDGTPRGSLQFQLMDWHNKKWEVVLFRQKLADGPVRIFHELAPSTFIDPDTGKIRLRLVALGIPEARGHDLKVHFLRLQVKRDQ